MSPIEGHASQQDQAAQEVQRLYAARFEGKASYRQAVWHELNRYFSRWLPSDGEILDLGAGHCEFINNATAATRYAMDLNPATRHLAAEGVTVLSQDCSQPWPLEARSLDAVFSSNFLEHLPDKTALRDVLAHMHGCLKPGGRFVAIGPNIRFTGGEYWDFFDHHIPLTDLSLAEALTSLGFEIEVRVPRFLPYTMSDGRQYPTGLLRLYLRLPLAWRVVGKQFLVVARKLP